MGIRKFVSSLMLTLLMLACMPSVFCVSGDWVEVASFKGTIWPENTDHFMIDYFDWRIKWSYTPRLSDSLDLHIFRLDVKNASGYVVEFVFVSNKISGTVNMNQTGEYYLYVDPMHAENYSITVEQNTQSIPKPEANWVEVLTVSEHGAYFGDSPPFKINHTEWRIKWAYTPSDGWNFFNDFRFDVYPHYEGKPIASMAGYSDEENGTLYIDYYTGNFYISFLPSSAVKNWTVTVEQNTDSPIQTENWVQVATLTGQGGVTSTDTFNVENNDWRILWDVEPDNEIQYPIIRAYIFPETGIDENKQSIEKIEKLLNDRTSGILRVYNQSGSFYIDINANIENYTIIVQQNIDSIPEFPSMVFVPIILVSAIIGLVIRIKLKRRINEEI